MSATNVSGTVATYNAVRTAIDRKGNLNIVYATDGTVIKERTIRPIAIEIGKRGSDLILCDDSLRKGFITLRIDRIIAVSAGVQAGERA